MRRVTSKKCCFRNVSYPDVNYMIKKIKFINATLDDNVHEMVDSSLIVAFAQKMPVEVFFLNRRAIIIEGLIKKSFPLNNIRFHSLHNIRKSGAIKDFIAAVMEFYILLFSGNHETLYVFSYANMFSRYLINFGSKLFGKKVLVCTHSELETVVTCKSKGSCYWDKLMGGFYYKELAPMLRIMVMGENILNELKTHIPEKNTNKFFSLIHPYYHTTKPVSKILISEDIHIGVVGIISKSVQRGFNNLLSFVSFLEKSGNMKLHIISRIDNELRQDLPQSVIVENPTGRYLPKEEYENLIQQMDYLYYPYPKEAFKLTASGAIFESIANLRPPLMYSNDYFLSLTKEYGNFGIFIDQLLCEKLIGVISDKNNYKRMCDVLSDFSNKISPTNLSENLYKKIYETYVY